MTPKLEISGLDAFYGRALILRRRPGGARRRGDSAARTQRRRQDDHVPVGDGPRPSPQGLDPLRRDRNPRPADA